MSTQTLAALLFVAGAPLSGFQAPLLNLTTTRGWSSLPIWEGIRIFTFSPGTS